MNHTQRPPLIPIFVSLSLLVSILLLVTAQVKPAVGKTAESVPQITIQIEPPEVVAGPAGYVDSSFNTLVGESALQAYVANSATRIYKGGSLETLRLLENVVIQGGADFDSCGAWLGRTWQDGAIVRGWYHAETECDYTQGLTHKSVAYAESYDGGLTFAKPNYPNNQVLTTPSVYTNPDQDDEGDQRVIRVGNYFYMYFLTTRTWRIHLARSLVSDGGLPGTWYKYYNGSFSQPGLGGESSPIADYPQLANTWVSYNTYLGQYMGFGGIWQDGQTRPDGLSLTFSADGLNWQPIPYLVLASKDEWLPRDENSQELVAYPSMVSRYSDNDRIGDVFWLYYMYLNPGEDFDQRYLLRRKVRIAYTSSAAPIEIVPRIALAHYQSAADSWFTTTSTDPDYELVNTAGYLFTSEIPNSIPLYDCYIDFWDDHMLAPNDPSCDGAKFLRRVGWISTVPFVDSILVYRCFDAVNTNHFISTDPNCNGATTEWPMGYLASGDTIPPNRFIALSNYHKQAAQDNWVTTANPPLDYAFERRFGYLFTAEEPNTKPVYDCYIDFWDDHMLVPDDVTCGGAQNLGLMGWISEVKLPGSIPIYRCFDESLTNHFVWLDPSCNGEHFEWIIGYVTIKPAIERSLFLPFLMQND